MAKHSFLRALAETSLSHTKVLFGVKLMNWALVLNLRQSQVETVRASLADMVVVVFFSLCGVAELFGGLLLFVLVGFPDLKMIEFLSLYIGV